MNVRGLIVDNFAGGGGASLGLEAALGRPVDLAINHDAEAIAMHEANHPRTRHLHTDIWDVDPVAATDGRPVDLAWFSPDCTHHSRAKGGKPRSQKIRGLAWVVLRWAATVRPRLIMLENVTEFADWGPLTRGKRPCPRRRGFTFERWKQQLAELGYEIEHRELAACDYGAPTLRKRLFLVARRDGEPIVWPEPTHGPGREPYRAAAECIDWSIPCPSIFERKRPLAENTLRRIAKGVQRYVLEAAEPFLIPLTHHGDSRVYSLAEPLRTVTGAHRGELALVAPYIAPRYGERPTQEPRTHAVTGPLPTITPTANGARLVAAFLAKHYGGHETPGSALVAPVSTVTAKDHHAYVSAHLLNLKGSDRRDRPVTGAAFTQTARGNHQALVATLLERYCGVAPGVPVMIGGEPYCVVDIGMRMLAPRELYRAQGFPDSVVIDPIFNGKPLTKTAQVRMCGNSVVPVMAEALATANVARAATRAA